MTARASVLRKVQRGRLCTGCGACASLVPAIRMITSEDGFNRPVADAPLDRDDNALVQAVCPGLAISGSGSREADPLWGSINTLRSGHADDAELRHRASSGGALSAILVHLLESNAVDFILHTAADSSDPVANVSCVSRSRSDVLKAAGSRYAPSSPLTDIERHLSSDQKFAFVGKPCDVAALRAMARFDPRVDMNVACMISFFCAGVPSRRGAAQILNRLGVRGGFLSAFRYRGYGWPGSATATLQDGTQRRMSYRESWGDILSKHVQFRCKICPDGTGNGADIVCADAWHGDSAGYPSFEEADGQSLIVTRTARGEAIVQAARQSRMLTAQLRDASLLEGMQPGQVSRMRVLVARLAALWITAQPRPVYRGFALYRAARRASVFELLRNFLGTGRRVILGRR